MSGFMPVTECGFFPGPEGALYYELIQGEQSEQGQTFVLLAGLTRSHTVWRHVIPLLLEAHHTVLLIDNRDAGQSFRAASPYTVEAMAEETAGLIASLDLGPFNLVGHSMGGFMALYIAAALKDQVSHLILCSTAVKQVDAAKVYLQHRIDLVQDQEAASGSGSFSISEASIRKVLPLLYSQAFCKDAGKVQEVVDYECGHPYPQAPDAFRRQAQACVAHDASAILARITAPTLLLTGDQDPYYTPEVAEYAATQLQAAKDEVHVIVGSAHMLQIEQPKAMWEAIQAFTSDQAGGSGAALC